MNRVLLACAVASSLALAGGAPKKAEPPVKKGLQAPGYLSPLARSLLKRRMERHGSDMLRLVQSVLFLDRAQTQRLAAEIAAEPRLTRPMPGEEDDLNRSLPERFFVLQDELRLKAKELAAQTPSADDVALSQRLGDLMETCVSCHSAYLEPKTDP